MKLKIGIIGTNFISSDFCEAAALIPEAELYAVCSRKQETGNRKPETGLPESTEFPGYIRITTPFLLPDWMRSMWRLPTLFTANRL